VGYTAGDLKGVPMWNDQTRDAVIRIRFLTMCGMILWAFWGLVQLAESNSERRGLIWTSPDSEVAAMLSNLSWDDDAPECPKFAE
ncbi:MAG: hypothetical protein ACHRHE_16330, partial [Tepidisphaerales bacterium]